MNTFALAFIASLAGSKPAPVSTGIIPLGHVSTVVPAREAHLGHHTALAPVVRYVDSAPGCVTRTLANDSSGQKVTYCR